MDTFLYSEEEVRGLSIDGFLTMDIHDFFAVFVRERGRYEQEQNSRLFYLFDVLSATVILPWFPDQGEVFGPPEQLNSYRLFEDANLKDSDAEILRVVLNNINNPVLRARLGDILWFFKKDYVSAKIAVSAYVEDAKITDNAQEWIDPIFALIRALSIAKSLGKNNPQIETVLKHVESCVIRESGRDSLFYSNRLIHLLLDNDHGDNKQLAAFAESLARGEEQSSEFSPDRSEQHWRLTARCYHKLGDEINERRAIIESAET